MKIVLLGATGMVGQGVLRRCIGANDVTEIIVITRHPFVGYTDAKISNVIVPDLAKFQADATLFSGVDACYFCLGRTSLGLTEVAYRAITYDLTLHIAQQLLQYNSHEMSMVYLSGIGADSTEKSKTMWKRVRGATENALQQLPFQYLAIFRPEMILPEAGINSKTFAYRWTYRLLKPFYPLLKKYYYKNLLTTQMVGEAMLNLTRFGTTTVICDVATIQKMAVRSG